MPTVNYTKALQREYVELFKGLEVRIDKFSVVDRTAKSIVDGKPKYQEVADPLGLPWFMVAAIHSLESSQNFNTHLHNGDPLTARTKLVPEGRPITGSPPFSWTESATDALKLKYLHRIQSWPLSRILYELERYNGWGYRRHHPEVKTPYLWSFSHHYSTGKYVADGTWKDTAISNQIGAAVIIKRLEELGEIEPLTEPDFNKYPLRYSERKLARGMDFQRFLNTFNGVSLRVDGKLGPKSSDATSAIFGFYLDGDPRN